MTMSLPDMRLRIEAGLAKEYRVENGQVKVRSVRSRNWHRLTPRQLSVHVKRNTVVAHWLQSRMGWRRLLRACLTPDQYAGAQAA